jgi:hypothetical protein
MKAKKIKRKPLQKQNKKYTKWQKFYFISFITGLVLMIFEINLFRRTIIHLWIPVAIILTVGIISFLFNRTHFNLTTHSNGWFFPLLQNIASWGFISCYFFMAMNYYFAKVEQHKATFEIKSKSSMPGSRGHRNKRKPLVTIDYFGFEKELVFTYKDTEKVANATMVMLISRKGLLGFDILESYETVDGRN